MTTHSTHIINLEGRDKASMVMNKLSLSMEGLEHNALMAGMKLTSLAGVFMGMGISTHAVGSAILGVVRGMAEANKASGDLRGKLLLMDFSAQATISAVDDLRNSLSRTTFVGLRGMSAETANLVGTFDSDLRQSVADATAKLEEMGFDGKAAFEALAQAATGNMKPLKDLGVEAGSYADAQQKVNEKHAIWLSQLNPAQASMRELGLSFRALAADLRPVGETAVAVGGMIGKGLVDPVREKVEDVRKIFRGDLVQAIQGSASLIYEAAGFALNPLGVLFGGLRDLWDGVWSKITSGIPGVFGAVKDAAVAAWRAVSSWWSDTALPGLRGAWEGMWKGVMAFPATLVQGFMEIGRNLVNALIRVVNWGIDKLNALSFTLPDWVPGIGGNTLGLNIGRISELGPTQAQTIVIPVQIGDRRIEEVVVDVLDGQVRLREPGMGLA